MANIDKPTIHFFRSYWKDESCWGKKPEQLLVIPKI